MTEPNQNEDTSEGVQVISLLESLELPEDTPSFTATKPVQAQQLEVEIKAASEATRVEITYADIDVQDADHPVTVYVVGAKSKKSVNDAIAAHNADEQYGWSEEQVARAEALATIQDPNSTPTIEDLTLALRVLLTPIESAPAEEPPADPGAPA